MHGSSSNIYDSWRSQRNHKEPHPQYLDSHHYPQKSVPYPPNDLYNMDPHQPMGMYTYNPRRYHDYDADF